MNDRKVNEMCQLIFYDFTLNDEIEKHLKKSHFDQLGLNYNTISIIGPQSSGKSTLLNKLFNTNFDVMTTDKGRGQTTKGIWLASHTDSKTLILDCEGTDSKERGESRCKFEHTSALFCMALSDVLIINMWTSDVGRYTASNYGVLKIVFETNLKLFQQECDKKILIMLRDFEKTRHKKDKIEELILNDINQIWNEIKKPEKFANSTPRNFFKFEFITLPHKVYCENEFDNEIGILRQRFQPASEGYIFSHIIKEKNIPSDGLMHYFKQIWSEIQNEKDLNIPTQKEMLADYRCNEIKNNVLNTNEAKIRDFLNLATLNDISNFKEEVMEITKSIITQYENTANNYLEERYLHYKLELNNCLSERFHIAFVNQTKRLIPISQKLFRKNLENDLKLNENFIELTQKAKTFYLNTLIESLERKRAFESWKISKNDYEELFNEIIDNMRKNIIEEKKNQNIKTLKKQIDDCINNILNDLQGDFWFTFNQEYFVFYTAKMFSMKKFLEEYYGMDQKEFVQFCQQIENQVYDSIKNTFSKKIQEISQIAIEYFKKKFWYEENGEAKIWSKYEDDVIDASYKKLRAELLDVFDTFRFLKTFKNPLKFFDYTNNAEQTLDSVLEKVKTELLISDMNPDSYEVLLKSNQISVVKKKFDEGITDLLEDAKRRKGSILDSNLPWYGWALLLFFGIDDLISIIMSWNVIFLILIIIGYLVLLKTKKIYLVKNVYFEVENFIMSYKKKFIGR